MYAIVNKFLSAGDNVMSKQHLRQPGFEYSACSPFTKNKERIIKLKETDSRYIYQNELNKACFQCDMVDIDFKDLHRTVADKVLCDREFNIAKNPNSDGYQCGLASLLFKFFC